MPPDPPPQPLSWRAWLVLGGLVAFLMIGIYQSLLFKGMVAAIVAIVCLESIRMRRHFKLLKATRSGNICAFRKAFDCRNVDPWIIRATYQEIQNWVSGFPVEAEDDVLTQLEIDEEDLDYLIQDIARRSGYDLAHTEGNPLYDRVKTVGDIVHFINHQPKTRPV
jgi:hypothetical protein